MTKYIAFLVAPDGDLKFIYKRNSINAVKKELEHISKKWEKYKYRFIMEPFIEDWGKDIHWINTGLSRIVEAPEDLKFLEGKRMSDVILWVMDKALESNKLKA